MAAFEKDLEVESLLRKDGALLQVSMHFVIAYASLIETENTKPLRRLLLSVQHRPIASGRHLSLSPQASDLQAPGERMLVRTRMSWPGTSRPGSCFQDGMTRTTELQ